MKTYSWLDFSFIRTYKAMSKHVSQFVWYRKLWVLVCRYSYVNTFKRQYIDVGTAMNVNENKQEIGLS